MTDKIRALAEKLLELARRGVGGEKDNAQAALERHLAKHNLTIADIEGDGQHKIQLPWYEPDIDFQNRLQQQIVANVIGYDRAHKTKVYTKYLDDTPVGLVSVFWATKAEEVEIMAKLEFYYRLYIEEEKWFFVAFIQKNKLYNNPELSNTVPNAKMNPEVASKVFGHMGSIEHKPYLKQLPRQEGK